MLKVTGSKTKKTFFLVQKKKKNQEQSPIILEIDKNHRRNFEILENLNIKIFSRKNL